MSIINELVISVSTLWRTVIDRGAVFFAANVISWNKVINWFKDKEELFQSNPTLKRIALLENGDGLKKTLGDLVKELFDEEDYVICMIMWDPETETVKDFEFLKGKGIDAEIVTNFADKKIIIFE
jgi:hypothetical protein